MKKQISTSLAVILATALIGGTAAVGADTQSKRVHLKAKATPPGRNSTVPIDSSTTVSVPLGSAITWSADGGAASGVWYRYRVTGPNGVQRMIRDFGPDPYLSWTSIHGEGNYEMEITSRDLNTGATATDAAAFAFEPLATDRPVVRPTSHPQVLIYSAPPCASGSIMMVQYTGPSGIPQTTPSKNCGGGTMNFYVAGLLKQSTYELHHIVVDPSGARSAGPSVTGMSGTPTYQFADFNVPTPAPANPVNPVIVYGSLFEPIHASDLDGNIIWYYLSDLTTMTRPDGNGRFWGFSENPALGPDSQLIRLFDLVGSTLLETNAARVNEQLALLGMPPITGFHHEVRTMANGNILALGAVENILTDVQGDGPVDVIGDMILVLDSNLNVVWAWNSFDHLDKTRMAILGEQCGPNGAGCAPFHQAASANDWLHGNALQYTADGNILYSSRHQDWIMKIDYENGGGSGEVVWRLGNAGDFSINSNDPNPWFSHQHDANFDASDPTTLYVFDNGNTRLAADPTAHSRGQVYQIDEQGRTATPILSVDLGDFSLALGSAAKLPNGNFHFNMGWIQQDYGPSSRIVEVNPAGQIVFEIQAPTAFYRSFRMATLYAADAR